MFKEVINMTAEFKGVRGKPCASGNVDDIIYCYQNECPRREYCFPVIADDERLPDRLAVNNPRPGERGSDESMGG